MHGTLDWKQPIEDFEFLRGLPGLEVLALWQVICKKAYPALLPAVGLRNLKKVNVHGSYLAAEECALLEEGLRSRSDGTTRHLCGPVRRGATPGVRRRRV